MKRVFHRLLATFSRQPAAFVALAGLLLSIGSVACRSAEARDRPILNARALEVIGRTPTPTPNIAATVTAEARQRAREDGMTATVIAARATFVAGATETVEARRAAFWAAETATVQAGGTPRAALFRRFATPTPIVIPAAQPPATPTASPLPDRSSAGQNNLRIALISFGNQHVVIVNDGPAHADLTDWTLSNEQNRTYRFPAGFRLASGAQVTVYAGRGTNSATELFWGLDNQRASGYVWNPAHDTGVLRDASGRDVHRLSY